MPRRMIARFLQGLSSTDEESIVSRRRGAARGKDVKTQSRNPLVIRKQWLVVDRGVHSVGPNALQSGGMRAGSTYV
jgi:hypothetical protein